MFVISSFERSNMTYRLGLTFLGDRNPIPTHAELGSLALVGVLWLGLLIMRELALIHRKLTFIDQHLGLS